MAGLAIGLGALLLCEPALWTLGIGQANGLVMLGFAVAIWASQRGRWRLAGVGIGVAAALKLSPVLVLVYLALRGSRRRRRGGGAGTVLALSAVSAVIGRPGDLLVWVKDVFPQMSAGTLSTGNQSVVASLARTLTGSDDLWNRSALGPIHYLGLVIAAAALVALVAHAPPRSAGPVGAGGVDPAWSSSRARCRGTTTSCGRRSRSSR